MVLLHARACPTERQSIRLCTPRVFRRHGHRLSMLEPMISPLVRACSGERCLAVRDSLAGTAMNIDSRVVDTSTQTHGIQ
jgi:hypothetical protein